MTDIRIQRQSSSAVWWIVGILGVTLLLWVLFAWESDPAQVGTEIGALGDSLAIPSLEPARAA